MSIYIQPDSVAIADQITIGSDSVDLYDPSRNDYFTSAVPSGLWSTSSSGSYTLTHTNGLSIGLNAATGGSQFGLSSDDTYEDFDISLEYTIEHAYLSDQLYNNDGITYVSMQMSGADGSIGIARRLAPDVGHCIVFSYASDGIDKYATIINDRPAATFRIIKNGTSYAWFVDNTLIKKFIMSDIDTSGLICTIESVTYDDFNATRVALNRFESNTCVHIADSFQETIIESNRRLTINAPIVQEQKQYTAKVFNHNGLLGIASSEIEIVKPQGLSFGNSNIFVVENDSTLRK